MRTRRRIAALGLWLCLGAGLMAGLPGPAAAAELGPAEVVELERLLARLNFDPGEIDSVVDERTRTAIRLYQEFAALTPDGEPTAALLAELRAVVQAFQEMKAAKAEQERQDEEQAAKAAEQARAAEAERLAREQAAREAEQAQAAEQERLAAEQAAKAAEEARAAVEARAAQATEQERLAAEQAAREAEQAQAAEQERLAAEQAAKAAEEARAAEQAAQAAEAERLAKEQAAKAAEQEHQAAERERLAAEEEREQAAKAAEQARAAEQAAKAAEQAAQAQSAPEQAPAPAEFPPKPKARPGFDLEGVISRLTGGKNKAEPAPEPAPELPPVKKGEDEESSLTDPGQKLKLPPRVQAAMRTPVRLALGGDGYAAFKGGYAAARSGKLDLAIDLYTRAIDTGDLELEHLAEAFYNRANAHHYLGALKFAIQDYSAAILNKPDFPGAYYNRGFAFEANGQHTRALADFMKARKLGLQRLGVRSPDLQPPLP